MSPIDDFFDRLKFDEQRELIYVIHDYLKSLPKVTCKFRYNTLFYDQNKWKVYLLANKDGSVDVSFIGAINLEHTLLEQRGRKMVKSLNIKSIEDNQKWEVLEDLIPKVFDVQN